MCQKISLNPNDRCSQGFGLPDPKNCFKKIRGHLEKKIRLTVVTSKKIISKFGVCLTPGFLFPVDIQSNCVPIFQAKNRVPVLCAGIYGCPPPPRESWFCAPWDKIYILDILRTCVQLRRGGCVFGRVSFVGILHLEILRAIACTQLEKEKVLFSANNCQNRGHFRTKLRLRSPRRVLGPRPIDKICILDILRLHAAWKGLDEEKRLWVCSGDMETVRDGDSRSLPCLPTTHTAPATPRPLRAWNCHLRNTQLPEHCTATSTHETVTLGMLTLPLIHHEHGTVMPETHTACIDLLHYCMELSPLECLICPCYTTPLSAWIGNPRDTQLVDLDSTLPPAWTRALTWMWAATWRMELLLSVIPEIQLL